MIKGDPIRRCKCPSDRHLKCGCKLRKMMGTLAGFYKWKYCDKHYPTTCGTGMIVTIPRPLASNTQTRISWH